MSVEEEIKIDIGKEKRSSARSSSTLVIIMIAVLAVLLIFNQYQISKIVRGGIAITGAATVSGESGGNEGSVQGTIDGIIPTGTPEIYGKELGISFDDVSPSDPQKADASIRKLAVLDQQITLGGRELERYIAIGSQISCEYCCGAAAIIFPNGKPACGCAHSYAMRGLAKYLLQKHADEFTDDQILEELGKWKVLFFPDIHVQKAGVLQQKGVELNYINLASNKYRGIEKGTTGGSMVGGC